MENKISVIVPVYNMEKYMGQCLDSIINQTYRNLEIILINDGSTDASPEICNFYAQKDKRVRVIHQKNAGIAEVRNVGVQEATGDYIAFVDSDDWIDITMLEKLFNLIKESEADIAQCGYYRTDRDALPKDNQVPNISVYENEDILELLYCQNIRVETIVSWNKLYRRSVFDGIQYPTGRVGEDFATIYKILYNAKKLVRTSEQLYYYYFFNNGNSIMHKNSIRRDRDTVSALVERKDFLSAHASASVQQMNTIETLETMSRILPNFLISDELSEAERKQYIAIYRRLYKEGIAFISHRTVRLRYMLLAAVPGVYKLYYRQKREKNG